MKCTMTVKGFWHIFVLISFSSFIQSNVAQIFIGDNTSPGILYAPLPEPRDDNNILESRFTLIPLAEDSTVSGIDYDPGNDMVYWSDFNNDQICRIPTDGESPQEVIISTSSPHTIALDLGNGKIFWSMYNDASLSMANLDGSSVDTIYTYEGFKQPTLIMWDPFSEYVFWTARFANEVAKLHQNSNDTGVVIPVTAEAMALERCADDTTRLFYYTNYTKLGVINADGSEDHTIEVFSTPSLGESLISKYGSKLLWVGMGIDQEFSIHEYDLKFSSLTLRNTSVTLHDGSTHTIKSLGTLRVISNTPYDQPVAIEGCPEDIVAVIDDNATNAINASSVNWTEPVLNSWSSCPRMNFLGPGTNGGDYPVGITEVSYQATDAAGNSDICTFTVTVRRGSDVAVLTDAPPVHTDAPSTKRGCVRALILVASLYLQVFQPWPLPSPSTSPSDMSENPC
nr:low-density lipoprotein receptor-related protein 1-like [Lytechinus pictus]